MNEDSPCKPQEGPTIETPFSRIIRHRRTLDDALYTIKGNTEESKLTRQYIVGQIEALDFAVRMFEV